MDATRFSSPGVEDPQVVIDLGRGGHRRARIRAPVFLIDGDGRGDPLDPVHLCSVDPAKEAPRIGR